MDKVFVVIGAAIVGIAGIVFLSFLLSWPVMWLWNNALVGAVIGVNEVSWLQAWGISVLFGLLFKSNVSTSK
jgi:hypothetical protein